MPDRQPASTPTSSPGHPDDGPPGRLRSVCVFCGSSPGTDPAYTAAAVVVAETLVARGARVVYGGAHVGLMGTVADTTLAAGGEVVGVIPRSMVAREVAHRGLTELHVVESMHDRKALMAELSDGFLALPGGMGTLEELTEVLSWAQLGLHRKPIGLLDVAGYWDSWLAFLDRAVAAGFLRPEHRRLLHAGDDVAAVLDAMVRRPTTHG